MVVHLVVQLVVSKADRMAVVSAPCLVDCSVVNSVVAMVEKKAVKMDGTKAN